MKKYDCPLCDEVSVDLNGAHHHIEEDHEDSIPNGVTSAEFYYMSRTGKTHGNCIVCKNKTYWNESTNKYHRFCNRPSCKDSYREEFKKRMVGKYGKTTLLDDPIHQRKMLSNRSISGQYKWSDGKMKDYTGSYEHDFLKFLDIFMDFDSEDIFAPSPHTYYYEYEGDRKFYIPDFFIPSLNLEIEVKDGGDNPNNHHKIQRVDKVKEKKKDEVLESQKEYNYIKIVNKEYAGFIKYLMTRKEDFDQTNKNKADFIVTEQSMMLDEYSNQIPEVRGIDGHIHVSLENEYSYDNMSMPPFVYTSCINRLTHSDELDSYEIDKSPVHLNDHKNAFGLILSQVDNSLHDILCDLHENKFDESHIESFKATMCEISYSIESWDELRVVRRDTLVSIYLLSVMINKSEEIGVRFNSLLGWLRREYLDKLHTIELDKFNSSSDNTIVDIVSMESTLLLESTRDELYPVYVLLTHSGTVLANVIKNVTKEPYSHSSLSFDPKLETMYSFGRKYKSNPLIGTFVQEDIKSGLYEDISDKTNYSLYVTFVSQVEYDKMQSYLDEFINSNTKYRYNFIGLIRHNLGLETDREDAFFCSEFVDTVLKSSGKNFTGSHSSLVKPYDFAKNKDFHFVSKGILSYYDPSKTVRRVREIKKNKIK